MPDAQNTQTTIEKKPAKALEKIRPELNLEKWFIWQPAKSKSKPKERIIQREITLPDGNKITAKVEVGFTNKGVLTTEDQKIYYAFIKLWEDAGRPAGPVFHSLRKLAKASKRKWGTNVIESLENSSLRLRINPFIWKNSYYDSFTGERVKILDTFTILSELKLIKKEVDGHITKEAGYFRFNDFILKNLLNNHTKPLCFNVILNFKSEIAQILYTNLDLIMADKNHYERKTKELFEDLSLEGTKYIYPAGRKQKLLPALKELQGVELSTGILAKAELRQTKDKKDYKVVFKKEPKPQHQLEPIPETEPEEEAPTLILKIDPEIDKLLNYFHQRLNHQNYQATNKEIDQATSLVATYGEEQTKRIIEFALQEAPKTKYQMRTLGAIFQYESEALKYYEEQKRQKEILEAQQAQQEKEKEEKLARDRQEVGELELLYQTLTEDQRQELEILINRKKPSYISEDSSPLIIKAFYQNAKYQILRDLKNNPDILTTPDPVAEVGESSPPAVENPTPDPDQVLDETFQIPIKNLTPDSDQVPDQTLQT